MADELCILDVCLLCQSKYTQDAVNNRGKWRSKNHATLQVLMHFSSDTKLLPFPLQLVKTNSKHLRSTTSQEPRFGRSRQVSVMESGMTTTSLSSICMIGHSDAGFNDDEGFDEGPQESWHSSLVIKLLELALQPRNLN